MAIGTSQAFRTQNLRLLGNLFDKNNFIGKKGYYLNSTGDGVDWRADINESSGIFYGGVISATIGGTTFNITAGSGQVITRVLLNNEIVTTNAIVSWNAQNNIALTYRTTHQFSYLYIDENGALQQQNSPFTDSEYKSKIILGTISHINLSTINLVVNKQNTAYGDSHRIYELANAFGPIKRSGLSIGPYSTNLRITRAAGSVFSIGSNYASDQFEADSPDLASANPASLDRIYRNGSGGFIFDSNSGSFYQDIDPAQYDNGSGTLQAVNNNQWTIQRLFFFPSNPNEVIVYYGDAIYNSYTDATAAISTEFFSEAKITSENAVFLGYLVVRGGAADLSSSNDGVFFQSGAFRNISINTGGGGGGGGATALDELTDVQIATPLGGQFLTYDSTTSFWKNRSFILDENNNELIKFPSTVVSAVNELTISNAATTGSPSISATGNDTNIGLNLISKGTGLIQINDKAISLANSFTTSGNFALTFTTTATTSLILPTSGTLATTSQIPAVYDNTLTLAGSGGIGVGTSPTFTANSSVDKTITISIADGALTIAKLENIATSRILGRTSPSTGPVEVLDGAGVVSVIGTNAVSRATNLAAGSAGQIPYQSDANTTGFSAAGTANQVLLSGGSGAPTWANQSSLTVGVANSLANALTINSPLTGTSYNGSAAISIGLQDASATQAGGVSIGAQTFAGNKTFKDNVIISGDLTVNGSTVTINSSTLSVDDKNIELGAVIAIPSLSSTSNIDAGSNLVIVNSTTGLIIGQALTKISGTGAFGTNPVIDSIISATQFTVSPVHATTGSIVFSVGGATDVTADGGGITLKGTTNKTILWVDSTDAWTLSEHLNIASGKSYRINGTDVLNSTTLGSGIVNSSLTSVGTLTNLTVTNTINGSVSGSAGSLSATYTFWGQSFNGTQNVSGNLTSVGNITGSSGITITAGGSNQNVVLTPSGTGYTLLNGSVGIGNSTPNNKLTIQAGDNKDSGPIINLGGNAINQFESGRIRFTEVVTGAAPFYEGAYLHYDGSNNLFHIGVHDTNDALIANDVNAISIVRSNGNVGIGNISANNKLAVLGSVSIGSNYNIVAPTNGLIVEGSVGIGVSTLNAGAKLHVVGNADIGDSAADTGIIVRHGNSSVQYGRIRFYDSGGNNIHTIHSFPTAWQNGTFLNSSTGALNLTAYNGITFGSWNNIDAAFASNGTNYFKKSVGIGITSPSAVLHANSTTSGATLIRADGTNGTLFSVVDDLSDSLMSVNNSAGLPVLEVFADDRIVAGQYGQNDLVVINNKVGIGTANPINKLSIIGAANIGDSTYNVAAPTNGLIVQGDVGIGTATPTAQSNYRFLQVNGTNSAVIETMVGGVRIGGFDSTSSALYVGTIGAFPIIFRTGVNEKWRITNTGVLQSSGAQTIQTATGILTLATLAGDGHIVLSPHGNGNVGIGTAGPVSKLHIVDTEAAITLQGNQLSGTRYNRLRFANQPGTINEEIFGGYYGVGGLFIADYSNNGLYFGVSDTPGTFTERVRINSSGSVGIGTTVPSNTLDINGTTRIRSISAFVSAATIFLTTDANGVLVSRTSVQVRGDIGAGTGNGSVTSVNGTGTVSGITLSGTITTSGDLTLGGTLSVTPSNFASQTANTFLAAPNGAAGVPTFRAMASADIPNDGIVTAKILNSNVTYAKIQNVSATSRILGRISANAGVIEELTGANVATIIGANAIENATNVNITTDDATNSSYYLYFGANASGNTPLKASTKIRYNPSSGAFSATTKSFRIPHPTKPKHDLVYGSLESPYHGIRLTGKGKTKGNRAEIILPDYVKVLIDEETINIQLSVIKCAKILYIDDIFINDNKFTVKYDKSWYEKSKDVEFYWDFTAERKDVPKLIVEEKI